MPTNATKILGAVVVCSLLSTISTAQTQQDIQTLGKEVVEKSGLHFAKSETDLFEFAAAQVSKPCDAFEVSWTAQREKELVLLKETQEKRVPQQFLVKSRSKLEYCGGAIPPFELAAVTVVILGATDSGEIRGTQLIQQMSDPRMMILECAQLFGQQPRPGEKCGMFFLSKAILNVRMPVGAEITKLYIFERVFVSPQQWRWEKLGKVELHESD